MAAADITAKDTVLKGVNSLSNYVCYEAHLIDGSEHSGILAADTHDLFKLPAGSAVTGLTVVSLDTATSGGAATAVFKLKIGDAAEAVNTAIALADLAQGDTCHFDVSKIKAYEDGKEVTVQLTVGTAAYTKLKLLIVAEYLPVTEFLTKG